VKRKEMMKAKKEQGRIEMMIEKAERMCVKEADI
jgi:hypothetical protein